jgi:superoxide dismutase
MVVVRKKIHLARARPIVCSALRCEGDAHWHSTHTHVFILSRVNLYVGHINHSLFWKNLAPSASERKGHGGALHDGPLKKAIVERWGSLETFTKEFNTTTAGIQGSGWGWLVRFLSITHISRQSVGFDAKEIDSFLFSSGS